MKSFAKSIALLGIVSVLFYSCESNHFFKSKKKLASDLNGSWVRALFKDGDKEEIWTFKDGNLTITQESVATVEGEYTYSIDATITSPFLKIEQSIPDTSSNINPYPDVTSYALKWSIVQLDEKVLDLAGENSVGTLVQIEFSKQ